MNAIFASVMMTTDINLSEFIRCVYFYACIIIPVSKGKRIAYFDSEDYVIRHEDCSVLLHPQQTKSLRCIPSSNYRQIMNRMSYQSLFEANKWLKQQRSHELQISSIISEG